MPQDSQGRYVAPNEALAVGDVASAARTTTGAGSSFDTSNLDHVIGVLTVTAASGTSPTLNVTLETTADGTNYYSAGTFTQKTTTSAADSKVFGDLGPLSRWAWTIGGTSPSFTFSIAATADKD